MSNRTKIADCLAVADAIAARVWGHSPAVMGFAMFEIEMTESMIPVDDGIEFAAMVRTSGMKERESKLWSLKPATDKQVAECEQLECQQRLNEHATLYQKGLEDAARSGDDSTLYQHDCEPITLAIGLAKAFALHCPGEIPHFLLDEHGELGFDVATNSNAISNRKVARKHDRSRRKAD